MELWRKTWQVGFAPQFADGALAELERACREKDERLIRGATCDPIPLQCMEDWPVARCCAVSLCGLEDGITVGRISRFFAIACAECDRLMGESAACRWFLNWFDESEDDVFALLAEEILAELSRREGIAARKAVAA